MEGRGTYDGIADWYDTYIYGQQSRYSQEAAGLLGELLGAGPGRLLDQGCGGGRWLELFAQLGWSVVGVDLSEDQLRVARPRAEAAGAELVCGDATHLPFVDESFDAVVATGVSTDIEPYERLLGESARVLRANGRFVHLGTHPCFIGPFAEYREDGTRVIHPGYHERRRRFEAPGISAQGLRSKVGAVHVPLAHLLNAVLAAGLELELAVEDDSDPPMLFGLRARKRYRANANSSS